MPMCLGTQQNIIVFSPLVMSVYLLTISKIILLSICRPPTAWRLDNELVQMTNLLWIDLSIYLKASKMAQSSAKKTKASSGRRSVKADTAAKWALQLNPTRNKLPHLDFRHTLKSVPT